MPPPSCATSESWDRAQRVMRPQSGKWPATATQASGLASPPSGDAQVCVWALHPLGSVSLVSLEGGDPM